MWRGFCGSFNDSFSGCLGGSLGGKLGGGHFKHFLRPFAMRY